MSVCRSVPTLEWHPDPVALEAAGPARLHPLTLMAGFVRYALHLDVAPARSAAGWRAAEAAWAESEAAVRRGERPPLPWVAYDVIGLPNFVKVSFLRKLLELGSAVARLWVSNRDEGPDTPYYATGFLVGPHLLLTNAHAVEYPADADHTLARFDYGATDASDRFCEYACTGLVASSAALDYSLLRLAPQPLRVVGDYAADALDLSRRPMVSIRDHGARPVPHQDAVVIIQHPDGRPQELVYADTLVRSVAMPYIQYEADTEGGSSGSPVLDADLRIVALHHLGSARYNQGIAIEAIVGELTAAVPDLV